MQLKLSVIAFSLLSVLNLQAEDYVNIQYLNYSESDDRTSVSAPAIEINKDFGLDYTLNLKVVLDSVSGASPTYYEEKIDTVSTASSTVDTVNSPSAYDTGENINKDNIKYGNIEYEEVRKSVSTTLITRMDNRDELTMGLSYSAENDFYAHGVSMDYLHWTDSSKNTSINGGVSYQYNQVLVNCIDNVSCDSVSGASEQLDQNVVSAEVGVMQVLDTTSFVKASLFYTNESGYLNSPYHNVIVEDNGIYNIVKENKPEERNAYGVFLKYFKNIDNTTFQLNYRFYKDDWDLTSNMIDFNVFQQIDDLTINLGVRYYNQSEVNFYNKNYFDIMDEYKTSDERLSNFDSFDYKLGIKYKITDSISYNAGVSLYEQSTGLSAVYFTTGVKYKF